MKKIVIILSFLLFIPLVANASFDENLYYGVQNNNSVKEIQEFLTDQGVYSGPITGNFYSLTLKAVKDFQKKEKISPTSGFFGPLTRQKANEILVANIEPSNQQSIQETGSTPPIAEPAKTTNDIVKSLQDQIALLLQQIQAIQAQQTSVQQLQQTIQQQNQVINQIQQNTQQIAQNTCTPNWTCGEWTTCSNSSQTRTCSDTNSCGVSTGKPAENQLCVTPPESLVFTETPKLVWRNLGNDDNKNPIIRLSYITWKTNRPSQIVFGPVVQNPTPENPEDWTTKYSYNSCSPSGSRELAELAPTGTYMCKIIAKDNSGITAEYMLDLKTESVVLPN